MKSCPTPKPIVPNVPNRSPTRKSPPLTAVIPPFPPCRLLLLTRQRFVVKLEVRIRERFRQIRRGVVGHVEGVPCLDRFDGSIRKDFYEFWKGALFLDDQTIELSHVCVIKEFSPGKARGQVLQFRHRHGIVNRYSIPLLGFGPARLRDLCFKINQIPGAEVRFRPLDQTKNGDGILPRRVLTVVKSDFRSVIAIRQPDPSLRNIKSVPVRILQVDVNSKDKENTRNQTCCDTHQRGEDVRAMLSS